MRCFRLVIAFILIILFISISMAESEPTSNIKFLMDEPVSMLDWGLNKINEDLKLLYYNSEEFGLKGVNIISPSVVYNYDTNRIVIYVILSRAKSKEQAKEWCKSLVIRIKKLFIINIDTGKPYNESVGALYPYFSHGGYAKRSEPIGLSKELDNITKINVDVEIEGMEEVFEAEAPLLGTKINFYE